MDEHEAKNAFLLEKSNKISGELKEKKEEHKKALDKLNLALAFNQKLETYVGNTEDVVNKAKLFDANLAKNPITAEKVIPTLVDFAEKMEELLDEMRVFFNGLQPEVPPIAAENLPDISGEIPSLTGWENLKGRHDKNANKLGSTGSFRADTGGRSTSQTGTSPLAQNAYSRNFSSTQGGVSQHRDGRSSE